jgi:hypothetical protein
MKEKQFDHIENRFREAAQEYEQPFDEQSWSRMEQLLDKEERKRPPFLWIVPALMVLMLGGFFLYRSYNNKEQKITKDQPASTLQVSNQTTDVAVKEKTVDINNSSNETNNNPEENKTINEIKNIATVNNSSPAQITSIDNNDNSQNTTEKLASKQKIKKRFTAVTQSGEIVSTETRRKKNSRKSAGHSKASVKTSIAANQLTEAVDPSESTTSNYVKEVVAIEEKTKTLSMSETIANNDIEKTEEKTSDKVSVALKDSTVKKKEETTVKKTTDQDKKKKNHGFYVLLAGGVDFSSVKLFSFKNNPVVPRFGAGVGYRLNDRWSLQTGFYMSSKKYIAGPGDYKASAGSYLSSVDIIKVDANCLIYEIPVTVRYDFIRKQSMRLYSTAGLSSYLMKKEKYVYDFLYNSYPYQGKYDYTGNKSLFAVLSLSAGIEKDISSRISLLAEPIVNIPLGGVGEGKVKLYSTGLQLGVKYNFRKK